MKNKRFIRLDYPSLVVITEECKGGVHTNRDTKESVVYALNALGYKQVPDSTYGDTDYIIVDNVKKQWVYWENGFLPTAPARWDKENPLPEEWDMNCAKYKNRTLKWFDTNRK